MDGRFLEVCGREFEHGVLRCVEMLFKNPIRIPGTGMAESPVIGTPYIMALDHSVLLPAICAALCARERFRQDAPAWAPSLPLRWEDCESLENDDSNRLNLVGYYGSSLRHADWDYDQHPPFAAFSAGLLAYKHTPDYLRNDRELRCEFAPRKLKGICGGKLYWRSPATMQY